MEYPQVCARVPEELRERIESEARQKDRSISYVTRQLLKAGLKARDGREAVPESSSVASDAPLS